MRAAAYVRYSSDNQRHESIDAQLRAIRQYAAENDYILVSTYADEALTGKNDQRDEFLKMMDDAQKGLFDVVIVHKSDRFARNRYDSAIYRKHLNDNGVKLVSVLESFFDEDNPESVLMMSIIEGYNEFYSLNLAREVKKGQLENALKGIHNGGIPPLGFDVDPETRKLVINEVEAEAVRIIFDMYVRKYGYKLICRELNLKGYRTKTGNEFTPNSIAEILRNEKYIGHYIFNKRLSKESGNRKYKDEKDIIKIENAFPAIIDIDKWNKKEEILQTRLKPRRSKENYHYLLTGKIFCGCCGGNYTGDATYSGRNRKKYFQYSSVNRKRKIHDCDNKPIRAEYIENHVLEILAENVFDHDMIEAIVDKLMKTVTEQAKAANATLDKLIKKRDAIQEKINKLLDLLLDGIISKQALENKSKAFQDELEILMVRINELEANRISPPKRKDLYNYMKDLKEDFESEEKEVKQAAIDALVEKIIVKADSVEVVLRVCPLGINSRGYAIRLGQDKSNGDGACLTISADTAKKEIIPKYKG